MCEIHIYNLKIPLAIYFQYILKEKCIKILTLCINWYIKGLFSTAYYIIFIFLLCFHLIVNWPSQWRIFLVV